MKRLLLLGNQQEGMNAEDWWASKQEKHARSSSGKALKAQGSGAVQCAECGNEVKVLVSPRRNPHSSKLGRAVSMKDHDLCRRCWRRLMQQSKQTIIVPLEPHREFRSVNPIPPFGPPLPQEIPKTAL